MDSIAAGAPGPVLEVAHFPMALPVDRYPNYLPPGGMARRDCLGDSLGQGAEDLLLKPAGSRPRRGAVGWVDCMEGRKVGLVRRGCWMGRGQVLSIVTWKIP